MRADVARDVLADVRRCGVDWREMFERADGDWIQHDDHLAALDDERRQTQRRMIAALYWRAGALACAARAGMLADSEMQYLSGCAAAFSIAARSMEAAL